MAGLPDSSLQDRELPEGDDFIAAIAMGASMY